MHSHKFGGGFTYHHNSDFSGDVIIHHVPSGAQFHVPGEELIELVVQYYIMPRKMSKLEQIDWKEFLETEIL